MPATALPSAGAIRPGRQPRPNHSRHRRQRQDVQLRHCRRIGGKRPSKFNVVIFGGQHGDPPLTEHAGALIPSFVGKKIIAVSRHHCRPQSRMAKVVPMASPGGSKKGERRGGRQRGTPNKRTAEVMERERVAAQIGEQVGLPGAGKAIAKAAVRSGLLAKEEIEDAIPVIKSIVGLFQKRTLQLDPAGELLAIGSEAQWDKFRSWFEFYITTCVKLADFQSPKFKAIMVAGPAPAEPAAREGNVININDPNAAARVYRRVMMASRKRA